jgi:hypothetical protein
MREWAEGRSTLRHDEDAGTVIRTETGRQTDEVEDQREQLARVIRNFRAANPRFRISDDVIRRYHPTRCTTARS